MGSDEVGVPTLQTRTEPQIYDAEAKALGICASSLEECTTLGKFIDILGVAEQETRADVLRLLCYFLSSSAATLKYPSPSSAENVALSAVVGDREVYVNYDELVALHDLLVSELARRISLFTSEREKCAQVHSALHSTLLELKLAALSLRCCIRLLPLIELFDTGLRNSLGEGLDSLLQRLCSPTEPCLLPANVDSSQMVPSMSGPCRVHSLCALLEVFVDELLCRPKAELLLMPDDFSANYFRSKSRLTLEAILAHMMISAQAPNGLHEPRSRPCELGLPSAVILLDRVITDNAPRYLLSHVVRIVSQALEDSTCTPENMPSSAKAEHQKKWFSRFPILECSSNAESCKINSHSVPDSPSRQVSFWLVFSLLERGVSLYMKYASAPHLANLASNSADGPKPSAVVSNTLLASCLWSYMCHWGRMHPECEAALESMLNDATLRKGLEECFDQTHCCGHDQSQGRPPEQETDRIPEAGCLDGSTERSSGTHFDGKEILTVPVWEEDHTTLIADVLHLMHSALNFFSETFRSMEKSFQDGGTTDVTKEDIDDIWLGFIGSFHKCLPSAGEITAADSVGHVLVFFTDMLYYEAETAISDNRLREYLELLESLLISLLLEHDWRKISSNSQLSAPSGGQAGTVDATLCWKEENGLRTSPRFYIRRVVSLLQGFLEEPDLLKILGANAVAIILQINFFLNDFSEFMDEVMSTDDWREDIPTDGRRITRRKPTTVQEAGMVDRNTGEVIFDRNTLFSEQQTSLEEGEFLPRLALLARQHCRHEPGEHAVQQPSLEEREFRHFREDLAREHCCHEYRVPAEQQRSLEEEEFRPCVGDLARQRFRHEYREPAELQRSLGTGEFRPLPAGLAQQHCRHEYRDSAEQQPCAANPTLGKQQLRPSTLPILQRLMKYRSSPTKVSPEREPASEAKVATTHGARPVRKCRLRTEEKTADIPTEDETADIPTVTEGNPFVAEVLLLEKASENFDDLNDFIVCKEGRSYTKWLNRRTKFRRRKRTREIWKRSEEQKKLRSLLNIA